MVNFGGEGAARYLQITLEAMTRDPAPLAMCPYGDYDTMLKTLTDQLALGPYVLGERCPIVVFERLPSTAGR